MQAGNMPEESCAQLYMFINFRGSVGKNLKTIPALQKLYFIFSANFGTKTSPTDNIDDSEFI